MRGNLLNRLAQIRAATPLFKHLQYLAGPADHTLWHAGHTRYMYPETMLTPSPLQLAEENHPVVKLPY